MPDDSSPSLPDTTDISDRSVVLVTGATGYVGSRLVPELLDAGHRVVAATRHPDGITDYPWGSRVEARRFDIADEDVMATAVRGVDAVIWLVHSLTSDDFVEKDRHAAQAMARIAAEAGVERIVYVSGLIPDEPVDELSDHLRSRLQVEQVFLDGDVPATVLRAAMIVGAGSTSFELLRRLSERVPWLTPVPAWMDSRLQPVAVEDVVRLVVGALADEPRSRHYDVGGPDVLTYPELLALYADVAGLHRTRFSVPWVPRGIVGRACAAISGLDLPTVESLVDSLSHEMICGEDDVVADLGGPDFAYVPMREALARSLRPDPRGGTSAAGDPQAAAETDPG